MIETSHQFPRVNPPLRNAAANGPHPRGCRAIHNDRFRGTADDNLLEETIARRIDLLMRKPRGDIEEIASLPGDIELPRPANMRRSDKQRIAWHFAIHGLSFA
jgi:hypothetical protein